MHYHGKHEVNFNIKLDGTLCGTMLATPEEAKDRLDNIETRIHRAIAKEFRSGEVDFELETNVETDEPRITTKDVAAIFAATFHSFFVVNELSVFEDIVDSCIDDINQEIIDEGFTDPQEAPKSVIMKCTWRAIAMGMKREE